MKNRQEKTRKQRKAWKAALLALILTPVLLSCQSLKNDGTAGEFPEPTDENGNIVVTYDEATDTVSMPLWYWKKIVRFAVDAKGVE